MKPDEDKQLGALLVQGQSGNKEAYCVFLKEASNHLNAYLNRRMEGSEMVSDVLQDTLIAVHRCRHTYLPGKSVGAWMFTICQHRMIDHYRKYRRLEKMEVPLLDDFAENFTTLLPVSEDSRINEVELALSQLPDKQRSVIELLKIQGLSVREVSVKTGLSESDVKVSAFRGYEAVRRMIGVLKQ